MDDYELQQALEAMAGAAASSNDSKSEIISETLQRWQRLFGFDLDEAADRIIQHRNDLTRSTLTDEHWNMVRVEKESMGFDREAYEFEVNLEKHKASLANAMPVEDTSSSVRFLVELKGPLATVEAVQKAAGLEEAPEIVTGRSAETWDPVHLCRLNRREKTSLLKWASTDGRGYEPTILVDPASLS